MEGDGETGRRIGTLKSNSAIGYGEAAPISPNSGGTSPSLALNRSVVQFGGRDAGTFSGMTAVRSETSEYPDLNRLVGHGERQLLHLGRPQDRTASETSPSPNLKIEIIQNRKPLLYR
jgi:hypothetical protein